MRIAILVWLGLAAAALMLAGPAMRVSAAEVAPTAVSIALTPLGRMAAAGDLDGVRAALATGADINGRYSAAGMYQRPAALAAAGGHLELVVYLLENGAELHSEPAVGLMAAHLAAVGGHIEVLRAVVDHAQPYDLAAALSSALIAAAAIGHPTVVGFLLDRGVPPDARPPRPQLLTALELATQRGHSQIAHLLLDRGSQPRGVAGRGLVAAEGAAALGDLLLLERIIDTSRVEGDADALLGQAMLHASWTGQSEVVRQLLDRGVDPNHMPQLNVIGWNRQAARRKEVRPALALSLSGLEGHWDAARVLLDAGADPEPSHLLHHAARHGNLALVRALAERSVDLESEWYCGNAITWLVAEPAGSPPLLEATARFLLERGVSGSVPCRGRRPLEWARHRGDESLAALLEEAGVRGGTTFAYKLERLGKRIRGLAVGAAIILGGGP